MKTFFVVFLLLAGQLPVPVAAQGFDQIIGPLIRDLSGGGQPGLRRRPQAGWVLEGRAPRYRDSGTRQRPTERTSGRNRSPAVDARRTVEPPMALSERRQMQAALRSLGFYDGPIDGQIGSGSRQAIAAFQSSIDTGATGYLTAGQFNTLRRLVRVDGDDAAPASEASDTSYTLEAGREIGNEAGSPREPASSGPTAVTFAGRPAEPVSELIFDWSPNSVTFPEDRKAFRREVVRRLIGADPSFLEDRRVLSSWMEDLRYGSIWDLPDATDLYQLYSDGTEFDREQALARFKAYLASQATREPITVIRVRRAEVARYDFDGGVFPIGIDNDRYDFADEMLIGSGSANGNLVAVIDDWKSVGAMPVPSKQAEAIARKLGKTRFVDVAATLKLTDFSLRPQPGGGTEVVAAGQLEAASYHLPPTASDVRIGETIAQLSLAPEILPDEPQVQVASAKSAIESWARLGARTSADSLQLSLSGGTETDSDATAARKAFDLLVLAKAPDLGRGIANIYYLSRSYLGRRHAALFPAKDLKNVSALNSDRFRRRDIVAQFGRDNLPGLIALAPQLPVKVRMSSLLVLQPYDFETGAFPISHYSLGASEGVLEWNADGTPAIATDLKTLPPRLEFDERQARRLSDAARRGQSPYGSNVTLYLAIEGRITGMDPLLTRKDDYGDVPYDGASGQLNTSTGSRPRLRAETTRLAVYEDQNLTKLLMELPLDGLRIQTPTAAAPEADPLGGGAAPQGPRLSRWGLVALAARSGAGTQFLEEAAKQTDDYRNADEFDRNTVLKAMIDKATASAPVENSFLLAGTLTLGEHDGRDAFAVAGSSFSTIDPQDAVRLPSDTVSIDTENPEMLTRIAVPVARAKSMVVAKPDRQFAALFRVVPISARSDPAKPGKTLLRLRIEEVMLLNPADEARVIVDNRRDTAASTTDKLAPALTAPDAVRLETVPDRFLLTEEGTALLLMKASPEAADEADWRWLILERWRNENEPDAYGMPVRHNPWGSFFPKGYRALTEDDVARFMPTFKRWTDLRLRSLPQKATFQRSDQYYTHRFGESVPAYDPVFEAIGLTRQTYDRGPRSTLDMIVAPDGGRRFAMGLIAIKRERVSTPQPEGYLKLQDLPVPEALKSEFAFSVDFDLRRITVVGKEGNGGMPMILIDGSATEVRWWGGETAVTSRQLIATLPVEPAPAAEPLKALELDIVGLKLGMPFAEAEAVVEKHMSVTRVLELSSANVTGSPPLAERSLLYVDKAGEDFISLLVETKATNPTVLGVARQVFLKSPMSPDQIKAVLLRKYGETDFREESNSAEWYWGRSVGTWSCERGGSTGMMDWRQAKPLKGAPLTSAIFDGVDLSADHELAAEALVARRATFMRWGLDVPDGTYEECFPSLQAGYGASVDLGYAGETIPGGNTAWLSTRLFDQKAHAAVLRAFQQDSASTSKSKPAIGAAADLKL